MTISPCHSEVLSQRHVIQNHAMHVEENIAVVVQRYQGGVTIGIVDEEMLVVQIYVSDEPLDGVTVHCPDLQRIHIHQSKYKQSVYCQ